MANISKRLMAVCSVAVTTVYAAGYLYTMPSAQAGVASTPDLSSPNPSQSTPGAAAKAYQAQPPSPAQEKPVAHHSNASSQSKAKKSIQKPHSPTASAKRHSTGKTSTTKPPATAALYKDGVYTGAGTNPYGSLALTVTIAKGRISSVVINQYSMHYPQSVIDPQLPDEAVRMQTWRIYIVSGATASTYNFAEALYAALKKAKASGGKA